MNDYTYKMIVEALEEIGRDNLFDLIDKTRTWYYDALVWFNQETHKIEVDAVPHGDYPCPCELRILLHREKAVPPAYGIEDEIMCLGVFDDDEMDTIENEFDGNINNFLASEQNCGGTLADRIKKVYRHTWNINWHNYVKECINNALREIEEQEDENEEE